MVCLLDCGRSVYTETFSGVGGAVRWRAVHLRTGVEAVGDSREEALRRLEEKLQGTVGNEREQ